MTTHYVSIDQSILQHPGVARAEDVFAYVGELRRKTGAIRVLAAVLLAALVATLAAGDALTSWLVVWTTGFLAVAVFADPVLSLATGSAQGWQAMQRRAAQASADARLLATAEIDPRVMSELQVALTRGALADDVASPVAAPAEAVRAPVNDEALKRLNNDGYY